MAANPCILLSRVIYEWFVEDGRVISSYEYKHKMSWLNSSGGYVWVVSTV